MVACGGTERERMVRMGPYDVALHRGGVRHINMRVRPDGTLRISAPLRVGAQDLERMVMGRADWIDGRLREMRDRSLHERTRWQNGSRIVLLGTTYVLSVQVAPRRLARLDGDVLWVGLPEGSPYMDGVRATVDALAKRMLADRLKELFYRYERAMDVRHARTRIRRMTSRWGSCNVRTGDITINLELAYREPPCLESVVVHEFCHLLEPSHDQNFYRLMGLYHPHWSEARARLRDDPPQR